MFESYRPAKRCRTGSGVNGKTKADKISLEQDVCVYIAISVCVSSKDMTNTFSLLELTVFLSFLYSPGFEGIRTLS